MAKKYIVNVEMNLSVEAATKRIARNSVRNVPWEDIIQFSYPKAGFVREFRINVDENAVKILDVKEEK